LDTTPPGAPCDLAASTVPRWLDCAGGVAPARVPGQLQDIAQREAWGTAGLWARLRGGATRVVLLLADSVTGLLWPPRVAEREAPAAPWPRLFARARLAGLDWPRLRGVTSEGAPGLSVFGGQTLAWVQQQRCVWRRWRTLAGQLAHEAAQVAAGAVAAVVREQVRTALVALLPGVLEAQSYAQAAAARVLLRSHPQGPVISQFLNEQLDHILVHRVAYYAGLHRVTPEWPKVARLSPPPQLRPPSWRRPAFGAGRPGLGQLPQLRARAMAV
jgi:hypothetical protein